MLTFALWRQAAGALDMAGQSGLRGPPLAGRRRDRRIAACRLGGACGEGSHARRKGRQRRRSG
jgi:hypothetical protein